MNSFLVFEEAAHLEFTASKPDKYVMKIVTVCDPKSCYMINTIPYVGKDKRHTTGPLLMKYVHQISCIMDQDAVLQWTTG
jgi:hypothetical protein